MTVLHELTHRISGYSHPNTFRNLVKQELAQLNEKGLDPEKFAFYLNFFRYGVPPHGGSGTGLERIVKQMLNLENVAESTLLPRTPDRLTP
jgi:aspartyl/asparaginyl-tRNA synthetase